ncbi:MAG: anhydro-N-acetylmuramic acid kinase [Gammaproteobacteria bacterium]
MYYIGLMSGTSMDGVDAAVVQIDGKALKVLIFEQEPLPADLSDELKAVTGDTPLATIAELDGRLGLVFADAARRVISRSGVPVSRIVAIGSHGQTVLHCPRADTAATVQIGDPNRIALRTGITTVADFRGMDIAAGGQGAPLAPAFHAWLFRDPGVNRVVVNIGGIANISILPASHEIPVTGFDTGPGNTLLDRWARRHLGEPMDRDGAWGRRGSVIEALLETLLADSYFSAPPPKSTGLEYFNLQWLEGYLSKSKPPAAPADVQATLEELSCQSIVSAIRMHAPGTKEVLVCGGGVRNSGLMSRITKRLSPISIQLTSFHGIHPDCVEAVMCAWLAKCRLEGTPGNLPSVTGATRPVLLGAVYEPKPHGGSCENEEKT